MIKKYFRLSAGGQKIKKFQTAPIGSKFYTYNQKSMKIDVPPHFAAAAADKVYKVYHKVYKVYDKVYKVYDKVYKMYDKVYKVYDKVYKGQLTI